MPGIDGLDLRPRDPERKSWGLCMGDGLEEGGGSVG